MFKLWLSVPVLLDDQKCPQIDCESSCQPDQTLSESSEVTHKGTRKIFLSDKHFLEKSRKFEENSQLSLPKVSKEFLIASVRKSRLKKGFRKFFHHETIEG